MMRLFSPAMVRLRQALRALVAGPQALAFLPALVLAAFWIGGEGWLVAVALGLPAVMALNGGLPLNSGTTPDKRQALGLEETLDQHLLQCDSRKQRCGLYLLS
ncbi:MAG: diguanylate cyclase, partial [Pseudomonadota bacterium]|nr:diguanylate cyclase [Pseudomonadota bacterium]